MRDEEAGAATGGGLPQSAAATASAAAEAPPPVFPVRVRVDEAEVRRAVEAPGRAGANGLNHALEGDAAAPPPDDCPAPSAPPVTGLTDSATRPTLAAS